jgi:subtilisin-like proprotein convertase family protein/subtilisin family serine protease
MSNNEKEYYYAGEKKIKLQRLTDSFAVRYKPDTTSKAMELKLRADTYFADAEERKELPNHRVVIVTVPHTRLAADTKDSIKKLETENDVEFVAPVFRESQSGLRMVATDEITVRFKDSVPQHDIDNFNQANGVEVIKENRFIKKQFLLRVKNPAETLNIANLYQGSDLTEFAEPNFITEARKAALPDDEYLGLQWHLHNTQQGSGLAGEDVSAEEAWDITEGLPEIVIAIIDDGVDIDHPDLTSNIWKNPNESEPDINGWNFYDDTDDPRPQIFSPPYDELRGNDSHGTPCAGVAAAVGGNGSGVVGIAQHCKILPVKIFNADDLVLFNTLADAIRYAGQKADVLSNSWGIPPSSDVARAIKDVVQTGRGGKGAPVFVATGNDFSSSIGFPASVPEAIAVGASTNQGKRSAYSNYGPGIDFVAPSSGGTRGIFTTDVSIPGRGFNVGTINAGDAEGLYTNSFGGTSSATPLASGIAALMLSLNKELTWEDVRRYMRNTADKIDQENGNYVNGYSLEYGYGRVNAYRALVAVREDMENGGGSGHVIAREVAPSLAVPDEDLNGIISPIGIDEDGVIESVEEVLVNISHTYRGDLLVSLISPGNISVNLHQGQGGGAENLIASFNNGTTSALQQLEGTGIRGNWSLKVIDRWPDDTGTLNSWGIKIKTKGNVLRESVAPGLHIPDDDPQGITSTINFPMQGKVKNIKVRLDVSHTYVSDLLVSLTSPSNTQVMLHTFAEGSADNINAEYTVASLPQLSQFLDENVSGEWNLHVADHYGLDVGKLNKWEIEIRI